MTIEPMREDDVAEALAIDLASFPPSQLGAKPERGALPPVGDREARRDPRREAREVREKQLREELGRAWARLFVARGPPSGIDRGAVLGYLLFWHVVDELHLLSVAVAPAERRRGVGRALMARLLAYGAEQQAAKVLLEVRAGNAAAIALYGALGFTRLGVRARYYADGEDAVEMTLPLGSGS